TPFVLQRQSFHSHITPTLLLTYKGEGEFRTFYWVGGRVVTSYVKLLLALAGPAQWESRHLTAKGHNGR
ncbi:MAG: hypothetical protein KIT39_02210, partial [Nitrospirales bacterium]|nr:hypothetical protein [Nitrospirales bacterium]